MNKEQIAKILLMDEIFKAQENEETELKIDHSKLNERINKILIYIDNEKFINKLNEMIKEIKQ